MHFSMLDDVRGKKMSEENEGDVRRDQIRFKTSCFEVVTGAKLCKTLPFEQIWFGTFDNGLENKDLVAANAC